MNYEKSKQVNILQESQNDIRISNLNRQDTILQQRDLRRSQIRQSFNKPLDQVFKIQQQNMIEQFQKDFNQKKTKKVIFQKGQPNNIEMQAVKFKDVSKIMEEQINLTSLKVAKNIEKKEKNIQKRRGCFRRILGIKQTPKEDDNVIEISDSDEIIIDDSSEDNIFEKQQLSDSSNIFYYQPIIKDIIKKLQPWQINPKNEILNNGKIQLNQNQKDVCLSGFIYPKSIYSESSMFPLQIIDQDEKRDEKDSPFVEEQSKMKTLTCSAIACSKPAYFYCNKNLCKSNWGSQHKQQHHEILRFWEGCGKALCWEHFRFEYFIERDKYAEQEVIVNWHCTRIACKLRRRFYMYFCYFICLSPFSALIALFLFSSIFWIQHDF